MKNNGKSIMKIIRNTAIGVLTAALLSALIFSVKHSFIADTALAQHTTSIKLMNNKIDTLHKKVDDTQPAVIKNDIKNLKEDIEEMKTEQKQFQLEQRQDMKEMYKLLVEIRNNGR